MITTVTLKLAGFEEQKESNIIPYLFLGQPFVTSES